MIIQKKIVGIPERYNSFINKNVKPESDFWIIFCHQDFGFLENPLPILNNLDKNFIYGPYGIKLKRGLFIRHSKLATYRKVSMAEFNQGNKDFIFFKSGKRLKKPTTIETLDCFCIIMHSSLINKYNLKFDENLKFHMYVEELCINAKKQYGIKTKAVQLECFHLGLTGINQEFYQSADYVKHKHNLKTIICTTPLN